LKTGKSATALDDEIINKENSNFMNGFKEQN